MEKDRIKHKANYDLCLDWTWSHVIFPQYHGYLKDFGLEKLVSIWPPYRDQFENFINGRPYTSLRDTIERQSRLLRFHNFIMEFSIKNAEKISSCRPKSI